MDLETNDKRLVFETAFGLCAILYREGPFRAVGVLLPRASEAELSACVDEQAWGAPGAHPKARSMAEAIRQYFSGEIEEASWPPWEWLDFGRLTDLERRVLSATARIPLGRTLSYKQLAENAGCPRAYRFVGTVMAKNPFPVIIPCHRVVRSDRTVGKFGGGPEMKRKMIEMEALSASRTDHCQK